MDSPSHPDLYAWTTKLTPDEVTRFIEDIAEVVVAAELAGVLVLDRIPGGYWNSFDLAIAPTGLRPLDQIARVLRFQMNHALMVPHFEASKVEYSYAQMPRDRGFLNQVDIFWGAVKRLATQSGCFEYSRARRAPLSRDEWSAATELLADRFEAVMAPLRARLEADRARRDAEEKETMGLALRAQEELIRSRPSPPPSPQPYGVSPRGAEMLVAEWMRHMGILDAEMTRVSADGGVDATSGTHVAQVKHYKGKVGVVEVRQLFGVASAQSKIGLFFTATGYTAEAISFATSIGMPLFIYDAELGRLAAITPQARSML